MLVRVQTTRLAEIGPPDEIAWMGQGVAAARARQGKPFRCYDCGREIATRFLLTLKSGDMNRWFHEACLSDEDKQAAKWCRGTIDGPDETA